MPEKDTVSPPPVVRKQEARVAAASSKGIALRFIGGKYQGGEFPLLEDREIVVGRASNLDMVLVEDMVSRRHAKIVVKQGEVHVQDLGSTNGTFVNGERVKQAVLQEGDRLLIGTSILTLVTAVGSEPAGDTKERLEEVAADRRTSQVRSMSGRIGDVPLPDLLQLFASNRKSGVLVVKSDKVGRIYFRNGRIYYATLSDSPEVSPTKVMYRMLSWDRGSFDLVPPDDRSFPGEIDLAIEGILMEGARQADEMKRLEGKVPPLDTVVSLTVPLVTPLRDLSPEELDVLQLALNWGQVKAILDRSATADAETAAALVKLLEARYLRVGASG